eukprot:CAMPEP_0118672544 /NCGR_PEP_ID=MMETSP0785-20121206/22597_1 /TAXON_ID=91992 /ORGANISM="Bolidomonas pacifica, Strain CCMP 1866" /LENGTH=202 /DNA_ID=CAMNT_0006567513 /DNA_START=293 /DNA_END=901 /DNA_ORIENTATION=+
MNPIMNPRTNPRTKPSTKPSTNNPINKVAIVGGGVTGLTLALSLSTYTNATCVLYERRNLSPGRIAGGGIQVNGGAAVLNSLMSDKRWKALEGRMESMGRIVSDTYVPHEGGRNLLEIDVGEAFRLFKASDLIAGQDDYSSYTIMRAALVEELIESVRETECEIIERGIERVEEVEGGYRMRTERMTGRLQKNTTSSWAATV